MHELAKSISLGLKVLLRNMAFLKEVEASIPRIEIMPTAFKNKVFKAGKNTKKLGLKYIPR